MKRVALFIFVSFFILPTIFAQSIIGQWTGMLEISGGMKLRIVFNISNMGGKLNATMDSPDQGAKDIPVTSVVFEDSILRIKIDPLNISYKGTFRNDETIAGKFTQAGVLFPLNLYLGKIELVRPQEPKKPYPYHSEDIIFENIKDGVSLAGTLTLPQKTGIFPAVVLISGSGKQNRDEELLGHKPFLVLSDFLTRNGFAVLRYDDRGVGQSTGNFQTGTTYDFSNDAEAAFTYLQNRKEIDKKKIGLIGHSEGGIIAPMVAARNKNVAFIVLLAGSGTSGDQILLYQQNLMANKETRQQTLQVNRAIFNIIKQTNDPTQMEIAITNYIENFFTNDTSIKIPEWMSRENFMEQQVNTALSPWLVFFIKYDPAIALEKVKCPVLAINGSKDRQVSPDLNLPFIENALKKGGNKRVVIKELPGLNHLFQECETGYPHEYSSIEQTFSPIAMQEILGWLKKVSEK